MDDIALLEIAGIICTPPTTKTTPFGRTITRFVVAARTESNAVSYIPCVYHGILQAPLSMHQAVDLVVMKYPHGIEDVVIEMRS